MNILKQLEGKLIVSCQALAGEPLHDSYIMSKMAKAVYEGGAEGIRANSVVDIQKIKKEVALPVIGIIKQDYEKSDVYITATMNEVDTLVAEGVEVIALDATKLTRPDGSSFMEFFAKVKDKFPNQLFMADCSTVNEGIEAEKQVLT